MPNASEPEMRAEELVRRAEQHVDVPARSVDPAVRAVVDGVRPGERAGAVRELDDPCHVGRRPDGVRGDRERDDARPLGQLRFEVVEVEREVVVHAGEADDDAEVLLQRQPRGDVRVVVEPRADDLVAALELPAERAREQEVERRHARPDATSSGWQERKRPAAMRARSISSIVRTLVSYGAPMFALSSRR